MKENFKKYLKSNEKLRQLNEQIQNNEQDFWHNQYIVSEYLKEHTYEQAKEHFKKEREENEKKKAVKEDLYNERKKELLKNDLLLNNFLYLFINKYDNIIINIIYQYNNKNIGEKTKEKIEEQIKEEIKKEEIFKNSEIYVYFKGTFKDYEISIQIREKKQDLYIYQFEYILQKHTTYNCYEEAEKITYNRYKASDFNYTKYSINNLLYIDNINKAVNDITKEEEKQKKAIEEQIQAVKEKTSKYNSFISKYNLKGDLQKNYKIDKTIYLY